ncbi:unnamed protein product [Lepidochelys kempii]
MGKDLHLDIAPKDVEELLASHSEELTNEDLIEWEQQKVAEEQEDEPTVQETPPRKVLTIKVLAEAFQHLEAAMSLFEEHDPNIERSAPIQTQAERQKILSEFQQLLQFLEEQERLLLARLEKLEKEILKIQNDNASKLSEEISCLSNLISEMEGNGQEPASEFLQDLRSTLSRCEKGKFQQPMEISPSKLFL